MTNPNDGMTTETLLHQYGYVEATPGTFTSPRRPSNEHWQRVDGGWLCYGVAAPIGQGKPWGVAVCATCGARIDEHPADQSAHFFTPAERLLVPYTVAPKFQGVSGLHPATHPECFDFVWPDARVHEIYAHVRYDAERDQIVNDWRKVTAEDGATSYERVEVPA
jgi:hypothetical protein